MPYWAYLWPGAFLLAEAIAAERLARGHAGPGDRLRPGPRRAWWPSRRAPASISPTTTGRPSGSSSGARGPTGSTRRRYSTALLDWRDPADERYPLILGADVTYERRLVPLVAGVHRRDARTRRRGPDHRPRPGGGRGILGGRSRPSGSPPRPSRRGRCRRTGPGPGDDPPGLAVLDPGGPAMRRKDALESARPIAENRASPPIIRVVPLHSHRTELVHVAYPSQPARASPPGSSSIIGRSLTLAGLALLAWTTAARAAWDVKPDPPAEPSRALGQAGDGDPDAEPARDLAALPDDRQPVRRRRAERARGRRPRGLGPADLPAGRGDQGEDRVDHDQPGPAQPRRQVPRRHRDRHRPRPRHRGLVVRRRQAASGGSSRSRGPRRSSRSTSPPTAGSSSRSSWRTRRSLQIYDINDRDDGRRT